jgi:hypothetical protein
MTSTATNRTPAGRRPNEAIQHRQNKSAECEQRVRKALTKLARTNAPFTIEDVCTVAGVGRTFIYDKRRPELTKAVLTARDQSQAAQRSRSEQSLDGEALSWRDRALNAEALAKTLRATVKQRDVQIADLTGQLYDPDGNYLAEQNAELRQLALTLNRNLSRIEAENARLRRSLEAARANIKRERERNVTLITSSERREPDLPGQRRDEGDAKAMSGEGIEAAVRPASGRERGRRVILRVNLPKRSRSRGTITMTAPHILNPAAPLEKGLADTSRDAQSLCVLLIARGLTWWCQPGGISQPRICGRKG